MTWNTRYGMMAGGMMGGAYAGTGVMSVSSAQSRDIASGAVWFHSRHGSFVQARDLGA